MITGAHTVVQNTESLWVAPFCSRRGSVSSVGGMDRIAFTSWTVAPGGASLSTVYYVIQVIDANTFKVSATLGGASLDFTGSPAGANYVSMAGASTAIVGGYSAQNTEGVHSMKIRSCPRNRSRTELK